MKRDPNLALVPPPPDEEAWTSDAERLFDSGEINADQARDKSGIIPTEKATSENGVLPGHVESVGRKATERTAGLELVNKDHIPQPGALRESTYEPPKPTTSSEKAARDQGEALKHGKRPLGWDPIPPRVIK